MGTGKGSGYGMPEGWTPTIPVLLVFVLLEIGAYCALRWAFRAAHGG